MRIAKDLGEIRHSGNIHGEEYTIAVNADSVAVLSSKIYSQHRIPEAVLREVACNAMDSHIAAGKADQPIFVQLPSPFSPVLRVRDEGLGLGAEEARALFGSYFVSLTRESEAGTGHFGLGSKSPFAYAAQFTVIAVKDGVEVTFQAYLNERGVPAITEVGRSASPAANGVTVEIPVQVEDMESFVRAAVRVFQPFAVRPEIDHEAYQTLMAEADAHAARVLIADGPGYRLSRARPQVTVGGERQHYLNHDGGNTVVLGNVSYPLDFEVLAEKRPDLAQAIGFPPANIHNMRLDLEITAEAVEMDPARENLQYSPRTCEVLVRRVIAVLDDYRKRNRQRFATMSDWDRTVAANDTFREALSWHARVLDLPRDGSIAVDRGVLADRVRAGGSIRLYGVGVDERNSNTFGMTRVAPGGSGKNRLRHVHPDTRTLVVLDNGGGAVRRAVRHALRERSVAGGGDPRHYRALVLRPEVGVSDPRFEDLAREMITALGSPEVVRSRDLCKALPEESRASVAPRNERLRAALRVFAPGASAPRSLYGRREQASESLDALLSGEKQMALFHLSRRTLVFAGAPGSEVAQVLGALDAEAVYDLLVRLGHRDNIVCVNVSDAALASQAAGLIDAREFLANALRKIGGLDDAERGALTRLALRAIRRRDAQSVCRTRAAACPWVDFTRPSHARGWAHVEAVYRSAFGALPEPLAGNVARASASGAAASRAEAALDRARRGAAPQVRVLAGPLVRALELVAQGADGVADTEALVALCPAVIGPIAARAARCSVAAGPGVDLAEALPSLTLESFRALLTSAPERLARLLYMEALIGAEVDQEIAAAGDRISILPN
ncbi:hypothetical protein J2T57_001654 [Natronocella acetinitrilica]|uniref:Uncharacterized protein n=1 Tax=Natronocella acetinitrilica TaxID=414046 RepID=A0AAE3G344_9GAMM|nr:hypothetical protein [Natronocella acetinitrilica]MCP1674552.1 hypothetical protein [Natronocella acetinitrilica]